MRGGREGASPGEGIHQDCECGDGGLGIRVNDLEIWQLPLVSSIPPKQVKLTLKSKTLNPEP